MIIENINDIKFKIEKTLIYLKAFDNLKELTEILNEIYENIIEDFTFKYSSYDDKLLEAKIFLSQLELFYNEKVSYVLELSKKDDIYDDITNENKEELSKIKKQIENLLNYNLPFIDKTKNEYDLILKEYEKQLIQAKEYKKFKILAYLKNEANIKLSLYQDMNYIVKLEIGHLNTFFLDNQKYINEINKNDIKINELVNKIKASIKELNENIIFDIKEEPSNNFIEKINNQTKYINELTIFNEINIKPKLTKKHNKIILQNLLEKIDILLDSDYDLTVIRNKIPTNNSNNQEYCIKLEQFISEELKDISEFKNEICGLNQIYNKIDEKLNVLFNFNKPLYNEINNKLNNLKQEFNKKMNNFLKNNPPYRAILLIELYKNSLNNFQNIYITNLDKSISIYNKKEEYIEYLNNLRFNNIENQKLEEIDNFISSNNMDDEILNDSLYNIIYYYFSIILLNDKQIELKLSDYGNKQIEKIYTNDVINESKKRKDKTVLSYISISSGFDYNKYKEFVKKYKIYLNETKEKVDKENQKVYSSNIISVFKMNGKNIELVEDKNAYFMIVDGVKDNLELSKTEYLIKPFTTINDNIIKCIYKGKEHYLNIKTKALYEIPPQTLISTDFKNGYALMVSPTANIQELIDTNFNIVAKAKLYTYINDFKNYSSIELSKENDIITIHYVWPDAVFEVENHKTHESIFYSSLANEADGTIVVENHKNKKAIYDLKTKKFITKFKYDRIGPFVNDKALVDDNIFINKKNQIIKEVEWPIRFIFNDGAFVAEAPRAFAIFNSNMKIISVIEKEYPHISKVQFIKNDTYILCEFSNTTAKKLYKLDLNCPDPIENINYQITDPDISNDIMKLGIKSIDNDKIYEKGKVLKYEKRWFNIKIYKKIYWWRVNKNDGNRPSKLCKSRWVKKDRKRNVKKISNRCLLRKQLTLWILRKNEKILKFKKYKLWK